MKKAFDQTVREIKREVNKKVLKVPSIEQKVLDATSNEPWGPHGLLLADIAQATRNYHECQIIMGVIWKRVNDTGKNWRHVYKALTVLEYLVAHGSERVIDEIREHGYQIATLSNFQYMDSSGRDQGNNVRKKSQTIVALVNDKERIQEVRQKAAANRDKYRNSSMGSRYQPGSYSRSGGYGDRYDDDHYESRYGNRDDDRYGYGRDRDFGYRDDKYARYGDSYGREGDKYGRDYEDRYGQDGYRDDAYQGRSQSIDDYSNRPRSRSADRDKDRAYDDDGNYSSRGSGAKADDHSQDGSTTHKRHDPKYSEQSPGAPPSYEEAITTRSPAYSERDGEGSLASAPKASPPPAVASPSNATTVAAPPHAFSSFPAHVTQATAPAPNRNEEVDGFDEFDPRGSFSAAPATTNGITPASSSDMKMDMLDTLSESFSSNSLALVPVTQPTMTPETKTEANFSSGPTFVGTPSASTTVNQPFGDPFGDGLFKAIPSAYSAHSQQQLHTSTNSFNPNSSEIIGGQHSVPNKEGSEIGNTSSGSSGAQVPHDLSTLNHNVDILADILPPSVVNTQSGFVPQTEFPPQANQPQPSGLPSLIGQNAPQNSFQPHHVDFPPQLGRPSSQTGYPLQSAEPVSQIGSLALSMALTNPAQTGLPQPSQMSFHPQSGQPTYHSVFQTPLGGQFFAQSNPQNPNFYVTYQSQVVSTAPDVTGMVSSSSSGSVVQNNFHSQIGSAVPGTSQLSPQAPQVQPSITLTPVSVSIGSAVQTNSTLAPAVAPQPSKDKFEAKSSVWADTLSRGLVNLNISGSKTNPLADIGVDFDAINRKEKRMEKPTTATVTSTVTMGKAMGSGSGIGRAGANALRLPPNPAMGSGVNANMTGGPRAGFGMGVGYGVNQPMGMGMGIGQGIHVQPPAGFLPGSTVPGGYNPMMGMGNYGQRPYGGGAQ